MIRGTIEQLRFLAFLEPPRLPITPSTPRLPSTPSTPRLSSTPRTPRTPRTTRTTRTPSLLELLSPLHQEKRLPVAGSVVSAAENLSPFVV